jgi:hypothetical protein
VYKGPFSFMGDLKPTDGTIVAPGHALQGTSLAGRVFIFTTGKGSSSGDTVAWRAKHRGVAPAAIVCLEIEPVLAAAVIASDIPTVDRPDRDVFELVETGDHVSVDATAGVIVIAKR